MSSSLLLLRHDITAAHNWVTDRLTILDKERLTPKDLQQDFDNKFNDIQGVVEESNAYLTHHISNDPVLQLSVTKLNKSWSRLKSYFGADRPTLEPLNLSFADTDSISSHSSAGLYTARFESADSEDGRKFIPHLTPLYRAVIRAKVKHHRRSSGSSAHSSLSVSPNSSVYSSSPAVSPGRSYGVDKGTSKKTFSTSSRSTDFITLDLSDSEPEFEPFPWVNESDEDLDLPDLVMESQSNMGELQEPSCNNLNKEQTSEVLQGSSNVEHQLEITETIDLVQAKVVTEEAAIASDKAIPDTPETRDLRKPRSSWSWWNKAFLLGLLLSSMTLVSWILLTPEDCSNSYYHCGVFGMRKRYTNFPPH